MLAVKLQQLEAIKQLVNTYRADTSIKNSSGKTALDIAKKSIKDPNVLETVTKLLERKSSSTVVVHDREMREEKQRFKDGKKERMNGLRDSLKSKL